MGFSFNEPTTTHPTTEPSVEATEEVQTDAAGTVTDPDNAGTDVQGDANANSPSDTGGEDSSKPNEEGKGEQAQEVESSADDAVFFYGDHEVEIEIPQDVSDTLKEKGIDAMQICRELYGEGGKFELSDETKQKLYDAFGKFAVDAYLSGLKAQNDLYFMNEANAAKEREAADAQRFTDISKEVGGEDGWARLEEWALETLSDDELTAFNAVMESGNQYLQQYAVRELEGRRKAAQGDDKPNLIEPSQAAPSGGDNSPLSRDQYIREIAKLGERFGRDRKGMAEAQARLDARRRAGMAKGL